MSDFLFVGKCFAFTLLITFLMQIKISGLSIEARADHYLRNSTLTGYLQTASTGGARMLQDGYYSAKSFVFNSARSMKSRSEAKAQQ